MASPARANAAQNASPIIFEDPPIDVPPFDDQLRLSFGDEYTVHRTLFSHGWGDDGRGEALFYIVGHLMRQTSIAGRIYAPEGFSVPAEVDPDTTRTVALITQSKRPTPFELEIPVGWHSRAEAPVSRVSSRSPWWCTQNDCWIEGFEPGVTQVEVFPPDNHAGPTSIEESLSAVTMYDESPLSREDEYFEMASGHTAELSWFTFESHAPFSRLSVAVDDSVWVIPCKGEQGPCEAVLRSARVR